MNENVISVHPSAYRRLQVRDGVPCRLVEVYKVYYANAPYQCGRPVKRSQENIVSIHFNWLSFVRILLDMMVVRCFQSENKLDSISMHSNSPVRSLLGCRYRNALPAFFICWFISVLVQADLILEILRFHESSQSLDSVTGSASWPMYFATCSFTHAEENEFMFEGISILPEFGGFIYRFMLATCLSDGATV